MTEFNIVIPARYASTRLPAKPLADIAGKSMLQRVWERACSAGAKRVLIATDDERILSHARAFGAQALMTRSDHPSGTDRLHEVAVQVGWEGAVKVLRREATSDTDFFNQVSRSAAEPQSKRIHPQMTQIGTDECNGSA